MILLKPYNHIENFLKRFTIIKIGNLHIRIHNIVDKDRTTLLHNHPFNYVSIILKGGYSETYLERGIEKKKSYGFLSVIKRNHKTYHRIDDIKGKTITLFIAYGKYQWNAVSVGEEKGLKVLERTVNGKRVWAKKQDGIWFIGCDNYYDAFKETRHSIHQI